MSASATSTMKEAEHDVSTETILCPCGIAKKDHNSVLFVGMVTNQPISPSAVAIRVVTSTTGNGKVANYIDVCSNPFIQLKSYNREKGYPATDTTLGHGAPFWRWQILVAPFVDHRAREYVQACQSRSRKALNRVRTMMKLAQQYNETLLQEGETPLSVYLVGDITIEDLDM
jgi:hypothetical protein